MKKISSKLIALILAVLMAVLLPMQVLADAKPEYISELKVGYGADADTAKAALDGYTILSDDSGNPVDLNQNAGGGMGSEGDRVVYLGYQTTTVASEAITDLALMNMKGGYSVADYDALMEAQMKSQIIPFVENILVAVEEYRANYNSKIKENKERAQTIKNMLNKLTDDDTGKGLGDLLLNKTKYEMNDATFEALSDEKKKEHADILTIVAQSNGQAMLVMEKLLLRAADTYDDGWIDRFADEELTYQTLLDDTDLPTSKAVTEVAKLYDDDAQSILGKWDDLRDDLLTFDDAVAYIESYEAPDVDGIKAKIDALDENADAEELLELRKELSEAEQKIREYNKMANIVAIHDYLDAIGYNDGTLLDFFAQTRETLEGDITALYPLVASLTDGQRACLDFITLEELIMVSDKDMLNYSDTSIDNMEAASIYAGVDRAVYQKNGVALTSDALRTDAMSASVERGTYQLPVWLYVMMGLSAASTVALVTTAIAKYSLNTNIRIISTELSAVNAVITEADGELHGLTFGSLNRGELVSRQVVEYQEDLARDLANAQQYYAPKNALCNKLMIGFGIAAVVMSAVSVYFTWKQISDHYKVDYTPIPSYMIDEKDLVSYNSKGEKIVLKDQRGYYKAVECNRDESDENYKMLSKYADMNGDAGSQWLALYAVKNDAEEPILASSLKAVVGDGNLPAGYETGIHSFGSEAALNLNSSLYDWNTSAPETYVYFQRDTGKAAKNTGSNFSTGALAVAGGAGLAIGAIGAYFITALQKKKRTAAEAE